MLEQEDLKSSGNLMKEIVKGQDAFFNTKQQIDGQQGKASQGGQASRAAPKRSPA